MKGSFSLLFLLFFKFGLKFGNCLKSTWYLQILELWETIAPLCYFWFIGPFACLIFLLALLRVDIHASKRVPALHIWGSGFESWHTKANIKKFKLDVGSSEKRAFVLEGSMVAENEPSLHGFSHVLQLSSHSIKLHSSSLDWILIRLTVMIPSDICIY